MNPWYRRPEILISIMCVATGIGLKFFPTGRVHEGLETLLTFLGGTGGLAAARSVLMAWLAPSPISAPAPSVGPPPPAPAPVVNVVQPTPAHVPVVVPPVVSAAAPVVAPVAPPAPPSSPVV